MKRHLRLLKKVTAAELSSEMAYKWNFFIRCVGLILEDLVGPLIVLLIYTTTSGIPGWSFEEFLLLQGTLIFVLGFNHLFFILIPSGTIEKVRRGTFDSILLKPFKPLAYLTFSSIDWDGMAEMLVGLFIIIYSLLRIDFTIINLFIYIFIIILAILFEYSAMVLIGALSFLVVRSYALFNIFFKLTDFVRYPLGIYGLPIRFVVTFLVPVAVASFYPVEALLRGTTPLGILKIVIPVVIFFTVAIALWEVAMKRYTSAGG